MGWISLLLPRMRLLAAHLFGCPPFYSVCSVGLRTRAALPACRAYPARPACPPRPFPACIFLASLADPALAVPPCSLLPDLPQAAAYSAPSQRYRLLRLPAPLPAAHLHRRQEEWPGDGHRLRRPRLPRPGCTLRCGLRLQGRRRLRCRRHLHQQHLRQGGKLDVWVDTAVRAGGCSSSSEAVLLGCRLHPLAPHPGLLHSNICLRRSACGALSSLNLCLLVCPLTLQVEAKTAEQPIPSSTAAPDSTLTATTTTTEPTTSDSTTCTGPSEPHYQVLDRALGQQCWLQRLLLLPPVSSAAPAP